MYNKIKKILKLKKNYNKTLKIKSMFCKIFQI